MAELETVPIGKDSEQVCRLPAEAKMLLPGCGQKPKWSPVEVRRKRTKAARPKIGTEEQVPPRRVQSTVNDQESKKGDR